MGTASDDHTVKIWDLRQKKCNYTIPAHSDLISDVKFQVCSYSFVHRTISFVTIELTHRFQPDIGDFLVTASFDKTCRVWSTRDWSPITTLAGHEGKVMHVDVSHGTHLFAYVFFW